MIVLVGSDAILHGQVWRLVTTWIVHQPSGPGSVGHIITTLLGLYFLAPSLEERWGARRFVFFVVGSGVALLRLAGLLLFRVLLPALRLQPPRIVHRGLWLDGRPPNNLC